MDFLIQYAGYKRLIEIKSGKIINTDFFRGIDYFRKIYKGQDRIKTSLIYSGDNEYTYQQTGVFNCKSTEAAAK